MELIPGPIFWYFYHAKVRSPMKYLVFELLARHRAPAIGTFLFFRPSPLACFCGCGPPPPVRFEAHRIAGKILSGRTNDQDIG
jgi:hypothetical protein